MVGVQDLAATELATGGAACPAWPWSGCWALREVIAASSAFACLTEGGCGWSAVLSMELVAGVHVQARADGLCLPRLTDTRIGMPGSVSANLVERG